MTIIELHNYYIELCKYQLINILIEQSFIIHPSATYNSKLQVLMLQLKTLAII